MRLTRPTFSTPLVLPSDPQRDLLKDSLAKELEADVTALKGLENLCLGQTLILPQSFG